MKLAMLVALSISCFLLAARCRGGSAEDSLGSFKWRNPLPFEYSEGQTAPRHELRDPCIIREGETYYLVFTMFPFRNREESRLNEPSQGGSPGIALYSSRDLKAWNFESWLVKSSELPEDCPYKNRFWAPGTTRFIGPFILKN